MADTPIVGGSDQQQMSRKALEDAAADARHLMQNSPIIPKLVAVDIIARRLFLLVRHGLETEIREGWDIEEPALVLQTLGMSAQEKAVSDPATPTQLRQELLETVLPVVDIFCQMEKQQNEQQETVPGGDPGEAIELGEVLRGHSGDEELEARECSEGDSGEAGEA